MAVGPENMWIKFFSDAGLPAGISATYALTFTENRIQMNMLLDLNKEYLREMGIVCMGDVIAILRHAKQVHEETARDRVLGITTPKVPVAAIAGRPGQPKPDSTPTKRLLGHLTHNPTPPGKNTSPAKNNGNIRERLGDLRKIATKRKITTVNDSRNDEESKDDVVISMKRRIISSQIKKLSKKVSKEKEPLPEKRLSDVFSRLGDSPDEEEKGVKNNFSAIKISPKSAVESQQNVFARLGGKERVLSLPKKTINCTTDSLKYAGVLKPQPKKIVIKSNGAVRTLTKLPMGTMQADKAPRSIKDKLANKHPHRKSVKFSPHVDCKLIERAATPPIQKSISNLVLNHISAPRNVTKVNFAAKNNIKLRLGNTKPENKVGVFGRLGLVTRN